MAIIFNGETLVAHHYQGSSTTLLITFIGAFHESTAETHYLMREAVEHNDIDCVGITARVRNLYISHEMDAIAEKVRALQHTPKKIVVLGQSTGGYAAVKFADKLGAHCVISFAPLYSLDVDDLELTEEMGPARQLLEQGLRFHKIPAGIVRPGMHPSLADCSCPVVFVYDTTNDNDSYAGRLFQTAFPKARFVHTLHVGHAIANNLASLDFLPRLLDSVSRDRIDDVCALIKRAARNSDFAIANLVTQLARWRPSLALRALQTSRARDYLTGSMQRAHIYNTILAYELVARGDTRAACQHLQRVDASLFDANTDDCGLYVVISVHGDVLGYDSGTTQVVLSPHVLHQANGIPVLLDTRADQPRFLIRLSSGEVEVVADQEGAEQSENGFSVVSIVDSPLIGFQRGATFLRGEPFNVPRFAAEQIEGWERFALIPISSRTIAGRAAQLNWLDERIVTVRASEMAPRSARAQADTAQRKARFRAFMRIFGA